MTFNEICDTVAMLSKRGDVADKIAYAVAQVTLRCHALDFFPKDRVEVQLSWYSSGAQSIVDVPILQYLPRYRAIDYVRIWDPSTLAYGRTLDSIDPRDVLDSYGWERRNRFYTAGDVLKLSFDCPAYGVQVGYFVLPIVSPTSQYTSWIAQRFPDIIVQGALAYLFNMTGKQEEARAINAMVGFETNPGNNPAKGPTLVEQLKQLSLEDQAR